MTAQISIQERNINDRTCVMFGNFSSVRHQTDILAKKKQDRYDQAVTLFQESFRNVLRGRIFICYIV